MVDRRLSRSSSSSSLERNRRIDLACQDADRLRNEVAKRQDLNEKDTKDTFGIKSAFKRVLDYRGSSISQEKTTETKKNKEKPSESLSRFDEKAKQFVESMDVYKELDSLRNEISAEVAKKSLAVTTRNYLMPLGMHKHSETYLK